LCVYMCACVHMLQGERERERKREREREVICILLISYLKQ
jgi:hypothetical protein